MVLAMRKTITANGILLNSLMGQDLPVNTLHFFLSDFLTLVCISFIPSTVPGFSFFALLKVSMCPSIATVMQFVNESSSGSFDLLRKFSKQVHDSSDNVSIIFWPRVTRQDKRINTTIELCRSINSF